MQFNNIRGFVPASQVAQLHGRTVAEERLPVLQRMVGQTIPLKVIEVDRERNRLVLSERLASEDWRRARKKLLLEELQPGDILTGRVRQLTSFGAFIDLGGADGLVHISELSWRRVNHPREVLALGQEIKVMVVEIDHERERIGLSVRQLLTNPWEKIDERYGVDQLVLGRVTNIAPFGAFIEIEEGIEGLIHASELDADQKVQPHDVLQPGQMVTARIKSLDKQRQRMSLSLRSTTNRQPNYNVSISPGGHFSIREPDVKDAGSGHSIQTGGINFGNARIGVAGDIFSGNKLANIEDPVDTHHQITSANKQATVYAIARVLSDENNLIYVEKPYTLQAGISQRELRGFATAAAKVASPKHDTRLSFDVVVHSPNDSVDFESDWQRTIEYDVQRAEPQLVDFTFRVHRPEPITISVDFYHANRWLRTIKLEFEDVRTDASHIVEQS